MAPPPEYDKEPKAPDKSSTNIINEDSKAHNLVNDLQPNSDLKPVNPASNSEVENNKHVETLDDGQLRALLDEAIQYKCPKDREGKSSLFQELLEEVEQDEACEAARSFGPRGVVRDARGRLALSHANSMQDLVAALAGESAQRPVRHQPPQRAHASVSERATHGGSLPSGVDTSFHAAEEPVTGGGYLATVRCVNPPPLAERRVSASDANCPAELELLNKRSKTTFPMYTARATLEIGSGSVCSGRAVTTTTASNQVDSAIPFSCITTPEVVTSCNTTSSTSQSAVAVDPKPRSVIGYNGLSGPRQHGFIVASAPEEHKKSLDENGNAVQGISSPSLHKKPRRKKSSKNETVINLHQIDGYQGNKDLNELLRFIESNADNGRGSKLGRTKHKDDSDDKGGKKRSNERRKEKENKMKRATSMEELSRTKLEDLTVEAEPPLRADKKERRADVAPAKAERRSWGDDSRDSFYYRPAEPEPAPELAAAATAAELTEFQTVTKRRKPRRRTDEHERDVEREHAPRRPRPPSPSPRPRRESAPPSDRSNDSNDDMDSVHSLPADATAGLARAAPAAPAATAAATTTAAAAAAAAAAPASAPPHASYADIARTRHNIPDLIESCNFYTEGGENGAEPRRVEPAAVPGDADGYPALEPRTVAGGPPAQPRSRLAKPPPPPSVPRRDRKERAAAPPAECPAPDVVADRRPPVILLDSATRPRDMDGVTFGFDINEQLLGAPTRRPRCDLVCDAPDAEPAPAAPPAPLAPSAPLAPAAPLAATSVAVRAGCAALRYVPPEPPPDTHHLHQIIDYVGTAWEDVIRCGSGKVRYFSE
ncbi:uncharacterized protein LOC113515076 isoform X5 [Galleria mellonella]|uniref:Uncharacterized protein LOC113515076 isoform X5 n=1 Tax=Galleria mellonella TaxID=7137 RepID=A0ABM3MKJ5_GALME|nr:uncharacterized protein LOC113515076 isoform X5 [Galleria mellonella]